MSHAATVCQPCCSMNVYVVMMTLAATSINTHTHCFTRLVWPAGGLCHGCLCWCLCSCCNHSAGCDQDQHDVHCCFSSHHAERWTCCYGTGRPPLLLQVRISSGAPYLSICIANCSSIPYCDCTYCLEATFQKGCVQDSLVFTVFGPSVVTDICTICCRGVGARALSNGINSAVFFCFFEALRATFAKKKEQVRQQHCICTNT